ncbi:terpene synthase family protein [Streptomyces sp. NPDC006692]|uniref:terpene synthase family protein n=1 Tax=Streptomyces sp. NPDC006692 TaxID=3364758 RepID=UPI00367FECBA
MICARRREHARGELHNLPTILRHHPGVTWQEAADATVLRVRHHLQDFADTRQALPTRPPRNSAGPAASPSARPETSPTSAPRTATPPDQP